MENSDHATDSPEDIQGQAQSLMTAAQFYLFLEANSGMLTVVALFGIVTNIINIKTFTGMGAFSNGVNLTFLYLAVSDFLLCCWAMLTVLTGFCISQEARWSSRLGMSTSTSYQINTGFVLSVDPWFLGILGLNMIQFCNINTISITVYLAVARCLCVMRPLRFRDSISVRKTTIFVIFLFILSLTSRLPLLTHTGIAMMFDRRFNASRPTLFFKPNRIFIKDITWVSVDMTCCVGAQIILLICICIMLRGLRAAAQFRYNNARAGELTAAPGQDKSDSIATKTNIKENRIAKQMLLVSSIFLVCNTPKLLSHVTTNIEPEFDYDGRYRRIYTASLKLDVVFDTLNSSLNIFVYFHYNSKFRKTLQGIKKSHKKF